MGWQVLRGKNAGPQGEKLPDFFEFRHLMSHRGKGVPYIGKFCIPNNSLWFVLSLKPLNGVLAPPVSGSVKYESIAFFN